jgi:5'-3' exonuclease
MPPQVAEVVINYVRGLDWVMKYYYRGVPSWDWYYPYHYAPFPSDMRGLQWIDCNFSLGKPALPFHHVRDCLLQLCFPARLPASVGDALRCKCQTI